MYKKGTKVRTSFPTEIGRTGKVSTDYKVLGLDKSTLTLWKKHFTLVEWDDTHELRGEFTYYLEAV